MSLTGLVLLIPLRRIGMLPSAGICSGQGRINCSDKLLLCVKCWALHTDTFEALVFYRTIRVTCAPCDPAGNLSEFFVLSWPLPCYNSHGIWRHQLETRQISLVVHGKELPIKQNPLLDKTLTDIVKAWYKTERNRQPTNWPRQPLKSHY